MHNFPRLSGLGLVFFGAVLTKFSTWDVLQAARSGAESVSYSMKFVMVSRSIGIGAGDVGAGAGLLSLVSPR